jgi:hypothetical protein
MAASATSINLLFARDSNRFKSFRRFLRAGAWGIFLARDDQWVSYGWCAPATIAHPPHLPRWSRSVGAHWIFYCHTRRQFRGQGCYKRLLRQIVNRVEVGADGTQAPLILCDTLPDNFASRWAVMQAGFVPKGIVTAYHFGVPRLGGVSVGGGWDRDREHMPGMAASFHSWEQRAAK